MSLETPLDPTVFWETPPGTPKNLPPMIQNHEIQKQLLILTCFKTLQTHIVGFGCCIRHNKRTKPKCNFCFKFNHHLHTCLVTEQDSQITKAITSDYIHRRVVLGSTRRCLLKHRQIRRCFGRHLRILPKTSL